MESSYNNLIISNISDNHKIDKSQINTILNLLSQGNTIPFIARYRKEQTKGLDEKEIKIIADEYKYFDELEKRKEEIIKILEKKELLTNELKKQILNINKKIDLENLYNPFKDDKKTKASIGFSLKLDNLARKILKNENINIKTEILKYKNDKLKTYDDLIIHLKYVISHLISQDYKTNNYVKNYILNNGILKTKKKDKNADKKYKIYFDFSSKINKIKHYQILAINRAYKLKQINFSFIYDKEKILNLIFKNYKVSSEEINKIILESLQDCLKRLIKPKVENEIFKEKMQKAEDFSIQNIFKPNIINLLMQKPFKNKMILGLDPAFRTGIKIALIDQDSKVLMIDKIYPNEPVNDFENSKNKIIEIYNKYKFDLIAIGNGTASRETEAFIKKCNLDCIYNIVDESGASVYSASESAILEFPNLSIEERSAISIARKLQDPLAEIVKIDVKSIGVGQYQHDMNQKKLKEELEYVVYQIVNELGVDVNTSSIELLSYISGITPKIAQNIIDYKKENQIKSRADIKKIKGIGPKTYEQAIGFLRIDNSKNILDKTKIHPEQYKLVNKILKENNIDIQDFGKDSFINQIKNLNFDKFEINKYEEELIINSLTIKHIDARENIKNPEFNSLILKIEDLKKQDKIKGVVRNIVEFGAFVDIGLKNDALIHKSKIANEFVKDINDFLTIGEFKEFIVDEIDQENQKVNLSLI